MDSRGIPTIVLDMKKPKIWIESKFEIEDMEETSMFDFYNLNFPPSEELTNLGKGMEEAMRRISNSDKDARAGFASCDGVEHFWLLLERTTNQ